MIRRGISGRAFPCAVIDVGSAAGVRWREAFGTLTYADDAPAATVETVFDLASLTKVIATATLAMCAIDAGALRLDDRVADRLPAWRGEDREQVTIQDLLEHASGLTAYLPFFRDHRGRAEFEHAICTMPLEYAPRSQSIYSDLGFILLGFILEDAGFPLRDFRLKPEATLKREATRPQLEIQFTPPREWRERTAPTELDTWRGRLLQGEVHDENAWVLGGAAGHAGLFGTAAAVGSFARAILNALAVTSSPKGLRDDRPVAQGFSPARHTSSPDGLRHETVLRFVQKSGVPGSSRALAWDTMLPTSSCGTRMSPRAIGHTGFTGTSLWVDPELDLYVVLLTNRVHPMRENDQIQAIRRQVHDAVIDTVAG
jgi:CubicO group peptidase (beta-lactamase class C family)